MSSGSSISIRYKLVLKKIFNYPWIGWSAIGHCFSTLSCHYIAEISVIGT